MTVVIVVLALLVGTVAGGAAQGTTPARIVVLSRSAPDVQPLHEGLRELGHIEGRSYTVERRHADGSDARLRELAAEVVRGKPDIIYAPHGAAAVAAKGATSSIPIVFFSIDPVADGLVATLARPGGNATGVTAPTVDLTGKQMQLLREAVPALKKVAVLFIPDSPRSLELLDGYKRAGTAVRVDVLPIAVRRDVDFDAAFDTVRRARAEAITHIHTPLFRTNQAQIIAFAMQRRIPSVSHSDDFVREGGFMSYGIAARFGVRRAAVFVDKILKGARPADLPVEQPTKFEFAINLKTAKALGLTVAPSVIARADYVIQ